MTAVYTQTVALLARLDAGTCDTRAAAATIRRLADALALPEVQVAIRAAEAKSFQARVAPWMDACFGLEISADRLERGDRLLEEVFELLQSGDYPRERVAALEEYVWSRDVGDPAQEVGGVMVTLAAYCLAHGLDMHDAGETELARVWAKVEKIRAKQAAKPKGSALPQLWQRPPSTPTLAEALALPEIAALVEAAIAYKEERLKLDDTPEFCDLVSALAAIYAITTADVRKIGDPT